jgi:hypothetical protein
MTLSVWIELIGAIIMVWGLSRGEDELRKRRLRTESEKERERIARMM